ncbi:acyltransferase [Mycobacterium tuberculosis]|nr:acyltransferase [Mycobacterium tuberculosis]
MGYRVLFRRAQLGRCAVVTVRDEDRVVAEPAVTARLTGDRAGPFTAHDNFAGPRDQRAGRHERCSAPLIGHIAQLRQQQRGVRGIVAIPAGPPGRQHARHAAQCGHLQTGVVGNAGKSGRGERVARLGQRVVLECHTGFWCFRQRRHIAQRQQRQTR